MEFLAQNWWYILIFGAFAYMMFRGGGCCGGGGHSQSGHDDSMAGGGCCGGGSQGDHDQMGNNGGTRHDSVGQMNEPIEMVRDPECGMTVDPNTAIKQNLNGKTYYFCNESCRVNFLRKHQGV